jgi:HrpA-like RNA helicase
VHYFDFFSLRLYTEQAFKELVKATPPEMQRSDLAPAVLQLKALGIDNVLRFNFPSSPPSKSLLSALELLYALGAINDNGELTNPLGLMMAEIPLDPVFAKCIIASGEIFKTSSLLKQHIAILFKQFYICILSYFYKLFIKYRFEGSFNISFQYSFRLVDNYDD